jgi:hypothetical protein
MPLRVDIELSADMYTSHTCSIIISYNYKLTKQQIYPSSSASS